MACRTRADRLLLLRFGIEPQRADIFQVLMLASGEIREREGPSDVLVEATWVGKLEASLDTEFLSWIVLHYEHVRLFAVVVEDECCAARIRRLEWVSGKSFGIFASESSARDWLGSRPWPDEVVDS